MLRYSRAASAALFLVAFSASVALAQTAADPGGDITFSYGFTIKAVFDLIGSVLAPALMASLVWVLHTTKLPVVVVNFVQTMLSQQLLEKAIGWGINAVEGATKDKALTVHVANKVVAQAVQYAIDHGPAYLLTWLGGPDAIKAKIVARLNLEPSASVAPAGSIVGPAA